MEYAIGFEKDLLYITL